jgi:hypothetical protein
VNFNCTVIIEIKCTIVRHLQTFRIKNYATVRFIYLARLADTMGIDIGREVLAKIELNEKKYPVELSKNSATKYNRR